MPITDERSKRVPDEDSEDIVRLWWWNPGKGASTRRVFREDLDKIRQGRAEGDGRHDLDNRGFRSWRCRLIRTTLSRDW
jgi:hypothetical protein